MKFGPWVVAAAGVFAVVVPSAARAQDAPAPADPQPAPAPPAANPAPAAPAATPAASPAPSSNVSVGLAGSSSATPTKDEAKKKDEEPKKKPLRWRGTGVNWSNTVTTTAVGVGRDNIGSEEEVYSMGFGAVANVFLIEGKEFRLRLTTAPGADIDFTDSGSTVKQNEFVVRDLPVSLIGSIPIWHSEDEQWAVASNLNFTTLFPTSKASQGQGMYLTTSPRASVFFGFPLLGKEAPLLKGVFTGISARWDHRFMKSNVPVNEDLRRPRQSASGATFLSDQLSGRAIASNAVRFGSFLFFDEKVFDRTLWLFVGGGLDYQYADPLESQPCEATTLTGCVQASRLPDATTTRVSTSFSAGVTFFPMVEWGLSLDYANTGNQLGPDGQRRNVLYNPDANFSATVLVAIDAIYERVTDKPREEPFILFGGNSDPKKKKTGPAPGPSAPQSPVVF